MTSKKSDVRFANVGVRMTAAELAAVRIDASLAGISVPELLRRRARRPEQVASPVHTTMTSPAAGISRLA